MLASKRTFSVNDLSSRIDSDHATVSLSTAHAEYPASKMKTDDIRDPAMAWGHRTSQTVVTSLFSAEVLPERLDYVALFGLNRTSPTVPAAAGPNVTDNLARLIVDEYGPDVHNPLVVSTGFTVTNLSASGGSGYSILNQILNPPEHGTSSGYAPASYNATNPAIDTVIDLQFDNRSQRPLAGTQTIFVHCRDSEDVLEIPTLTVLLRQSGATVSTLAPIEMERTFFVSADVAQPIGCIFKYEFAASTLPSQTLPVQLRVTGETTGTNSVDFFVVAMRSEVTGTLYDSGWQTITAGDRIAWAPNIEFPSASAYYVFVQFSDYGYRTEEPPDFLHPYITVQHIELDSIGLTIGRFTAGAALQIPLVENGMELRKSGNNQGALTSTRSGYLRAARQDLTRWEIGFRFIPQSQERIFGEIERFFQSVGSVLPAVYLLVEPDEDPVNADNLVPAFWGLLVSYEATDLGLLMGDDLGGSNHTEDKRFDLRWQMTEANATATRTGG